LADAADHEVRRRFDAIVCRHMQNVAGVLSGQDGEQCAGFGAFAHDHGVGKLGAEQQASHARIGCDSPHNVGHALLGLLVHRRRRHHGLGGSGQIGDHPIEDRADEFVFIGEAFVEVSGGQTRPAANATDRQRGDVSIEDEPEALEVASEAPQPLARREMTEELKRLLSCLGKLDPEKQRIVLLAYYSGWSRDQLAQKLDIPVNTIKTWLRRSLLEIRECMGPR